MSALLCQGSSEVKVTIVEVYFSSCCSVGQVLVMSASPPLFLCKRCTEAHRCYVNLHLSVQTSDGQLVAYGVEMDAQNL